MADLERKIEKADKDGDGQVSPEEFVQVFGERELQDPPTHHWVTPGDAYIFTRRLMNVHVPKDQHQKFQTAKWFEAVSGDSLVALVRVPAVIWVILVLPIAIIEFIKIRNFVPGDDIHGCMAGKMLGTPGVVVLLSVVEVALLVWCWYLVAFLSAIKAMVRPRITVNPDTNLHDYHAPALHDEAEIDAYLKRHRFMIGCTDLLARASCNVDSGVDSDGREFTTESVRHHRIFGIAGHNGPPLILKAIKMHTWLTIASLILGLEVINIPDIIALSERGTSGPVVFETILYGTLRAPELRNVTAPSATLQRQAALTGAA